MADERDDMREQIAALKAAHCKTVDEVTTLTFDNVALRAALQDLVDATTLPDHSTPTPESWYAWCKRQAEANEAAKRVLGQQAPQ